ncbi:hypothetical protein EBZ39_06900 [bacterium]|nr:hypothetical protein [bacterium]
MPEGPEVLEYYNFIKPILMDNTITEIRVLSGKYLKKEVLGLERIGTFTVKDVLVKGKCIFIDFDSFMVSLTHGMTGWWDTERDKHSRIQMCIGDTHHLYYNDPRNFGTVKVYTDHQSFVEALDALGPDVLDDNTTFDLFYSRLLRKPRSKIGAALLDQQLVSGIGNYMRCDILWLAKLHYTRTIGSLTAHELQTLYDAVKTMCVHYLNTDESDPHYTLIYYHDFDVYGNKVHRTTWLGRTIHYVEQTK